MTKPTSSRQISRSSSTGKMVRRDKEYYLNNLDVEASLMTRAVSLAERMFAAFVRENNISVKVDTDSLADEILKRLEPKLEGMKTEVRYVDGGGPKGLSEVNSDGFKYDNDEPVIIRTGKMEIKGKIGKTVKSEDNIDDALDALDGFEL
jgi:hypothetical protein